MSSRTISFPFLFIAVLGAGMTQGADPSSLQIARDFAQLGAEADAKRVPILLAVTQDDCAYCEKLKEEILQPMLLSGEYADRALIRELRIDPGETVRDFAGRTVPAGDFAHRYKVWVTPTLIFLGPDGTEQHARILGINTVEFFGYYVDEAIDGARARVRGERQDGYQPSAEDVGAWPEGWDAGSP